MVYEVFQRTFSDIMLSIGIYVFVVVTL